MNGSIIHLTATWSEWSEWEQWTNERRRHKELLVGGELKVARLTEMHAFKGHMFRRPEELGVFFYLSLPGERSCPVHRTIDKALERLTKVLSDNGR